jgi:sec-independent protein translocase protein TatC
MIDLPKPLTEHLDELRKRLFWILGTWAGFSALAYGFAPQAFEILMHPAVAAVTASGSKLVALKPAELFMSYVKAALLAGFLVALPMTLYQLWAFVSPGLYPGEKRLALPFVISTTLLFFLGNLFGYSVAFPAMFEYFISLEAPYVETQWSTESVFSFMAHMYLAFGLAFQLPIAMFFLASARIVTVEQMANARRYAVVAMFVIGAVLTPPDVVSQIMLAVPLMILYEAGMLAARIAARRTASDSAEQPQPESALTP